MSRRTERIESQLLAELSQLLRQDVTDPRIGLVTLTRADVSPDLANATIFWSALDAEPGADDLEDRQLGLESAASFLRHRAARVLPLRRMPALHFRYDPSLVLGTHTLSVLREVAPETAPEDPGTEPQAGSGGGASSAEAERLASREAAASAGTAASGRDENSNDEERADGTEK